jgi:hypothetical protein
MFRAFKFTFGVDILVFMPLFPKIGQDFIQFSGHTGRSVNAETILP